MKFILPYLASLAPKVAVVHASHSHDARVAALPTIHHGKPIAIPERDTTSVVSGVEHDRKFNSLKGVVLRDESPNHMRALQIDATNKAQFTITDPNGSPNDLFGVSVDIHGSNAIVGVPEDDTGNTTNSGSAIVYKNNGTAWAFDQKLLSTVNTDAYFFGRQVAVHGDDAFVSCSSNGGGFSWFQRNASLDPGVQWEFKQRLTGNAVPSSSPGLCATYGMVFDGSKLVCGDNGQGYVFAYNQTSDQWAVEGILQPDTSTNCGGNSIAISGDKVVMGCPYHNSFIGTALVFVHNATVSENGGWGNGTELLPNALNAQDARYGTSVGIDGDKIIVGAPTEDKWSEDHISPEPASAYGVAYIWGYEAPSWYMEQRLVYSDYNGAEGANWFGQQVAILGDKAIVTSPFDNIIEDGVPIFQGGAARVFQQDSATGNWAMVEVIHSGQPQYFEQFGYSLGWDGTNAIFGAPLSDRSGTNSGAAFIHPTLTPLEAAIDAITTVTISDISGPAEKSLAKILVDLNEEPADLAGAIKNAEKALKKLKCPGDLEDDAAIKACEAIAESIELLELLLANGRKLKVNIDSMVNDAGKDRGLQVEGTEQAAFFGIDVALEPQAVVKDGINSATSTTGMTVFAGLVAIYSMW